MNESDIDVDFKPQECNFLPPCCLLSGFPPSKVYSWWKKIFLKCEHKYENEQLLSSKLNPKLFWWTIFQQLVSLWKLPIHLDPQRDESLVKGYFLWSTNLSCTFLNCRSCLLKVTIFSNVSAPWNYNGIIRVQIYFSFFCFQSIHISSFLLQSSAVWH